MFKERIKLLSISLFVVLEFVIAFLALGGLSLFVISFFDYEYEFGTDLFPWTFLLYSGLISILSASVLFMISRYLHQLIITRDVKRICSCSVNFEQCKYELELLRQKVIKLVMRSFIVYHNKKNSALDQMNNIVAFYANRVERRFKNEYGVEMLISLREEVESLFDTYKQIHSVARVVAVNRYEKSIIGLKTFAWLAAQSYAGGSYTALLFRRRVKDLCTELRDIFNLCILLKNCTEDEKEMIRQILEIVNKNETYFFSHILKKRESLKEITKFIIPLIISIITSSTLLTLTIENITTTIEEWSRLPRILILIYSIIIIALFISPIIAFFLTRHIYLYFSQQKDWFRRLINLTNVNIKEDNIRFMLQHIDKKVFDEILGFSKYRP